MLSPTPAAETPTIEAAPPADTAGIPPEITTPLACAILNRLFAIEAALPRVAELIQYQRTLDSQARAIAGLQNEVAQLRLALAQEREARAQERQAQHVALALHLSDPGRERAVGERVAGRPRA